MCDSNPLRCARARDAPVGLPRVTFRVGDGAEELLAHDNRLRQEHHMASGRGDARSGACRFKCLCRIQLEVEAKTNRGEWKMLGSADT